MVALIADAHATERAQAVERALRSEAIWHSRCGQVGAGNDVLRAPPTGESSALRVAPSRYLRREARARQRWGGGGRGWADGRRRLLAGGRPRGGGSRAAALDERAVHSVLPGVRIEGHW